MHESESLDEMLALRCQLGDGDAWEVLVRRWHPRLWRFIVQMVPDESTAEDVIQGVWLRVVRSMARLRDPTRLPSWLFGIARAAIADRFRQAYRQPPAEEFVDAATEDAALLAIENNEMLQSKLNCLPLADREAVILHYLEELPITQVAEICAVPSGTIKSRLHRARQTLRTLIE